MYEITRSKKFKIAYKKLMRSGRSDFSNDEFEYIVDLLALGKDLPEKFRDHFLKGTFSGQRECHITSNMLLIYEIDVLNKIITLAEIGTHAQIFDL